MFTEPQQAYLGQIVRTTQVIAVALILGVAILGAVLVFIVDLSDRAPVETPFISMFGITIGIASIFVAPQVSRMVVAGMRRTLVAGKSIRAGDSSAIPEEVGKVGELAHIYQINQIIYRAVLEGAAFMNLTIYMVEVQPMGPAIALCLLIAMFFKFPTRSHMENWINAEMTTIEQLRSFEEIGSHA